MSFAKMKKRLIGLACVILVPAAHAQDSVVLYGAIDNGIGYTNNVQGAHLWQAEQAIGFGNRWGLRGSEDLGGGLKAIFTLESGFNSQTGGTAQGGRLFGRQAFVGLSREGFGSVTAGRQYDSVVDYVGVLAASKRFAKQFGAHIGDADNFFNSVRINNTVKYGSASFGGFSFGGLYGFSNQASGDAGAGFSNNRAFSGGVSYNNGPLHAGAGYVQLDHPSNGNTGGNNTNGAVAGDYATINTNIFYGSAVSQQRVWAAAATYEIGQATLGATVSDVRFDYQNGGALRLDNYELSAQYRFTPSVLAGLAYTYTDGHASGTPASYASFATGRRPKWHQVSFGGSYFFSKRTEIYVAAAYQRAAGDASRAAIDAAGGPTSNGARSQIAVASGLIFKF